MTDLEPIVLSVLGMHAMSTTEVVRAIFPSDADSRNRRGAVFKTLTTLERKDRIESRVVRVDNSPNPSRYWVLPGGTYPEEVVFETASPLTSTEESQ